MGSGSASAVEQLLTAPAAPAIGFETGAAMRFSRLCTASDFESWFRCSAQSLAWAPVSFEFDHTAIVAPNSTSAVVGLPSRLSQTAQPSARWKES